MQVALNCLVQAVLSFNFIGFQAAQACMQAAAGSHCKRHHDFVGIRCIEELGGDGVVVRRHVQRMFVRQRNIQFSARNAAFAG